MKATHQWEAGAPYCSCGQDTVTCQGCGRLVCGDVALRVSDPKDARMSRNVGPCCWARFGLGHSGTEPRPTTIQKRVKDLRPNDHVVNLDTGHSRRVIGYPRGCVAKGYVYINTDDVEHPINMHGDYLVHVLKGDNQ